MTKLQKDHLMILLESIDSKMQVTIEAVDSLNAKIDAVDEKNSKRMDNIEDILSVATNEISSLHKKVDAVHAELIEHRNDTVDASRPTEEIVGESSLTTECE